MAWAAGNRATSPLSGHVRTSKRHALAELDIPEDDKRARFSAKVAHEVRATIEALARLETRLTEICGWSSARGA